MAHMQRVALLLLLVAFLACVLTILLLRPSHLHDLHTNRAIYSCPQAQEPASPAIRLPISFNSSQYDTERRYEELRVQLERTVKRVAAAKQEDVQEISRLLVTDLRELLRLDGRYQRQRQLAEQTAELVQRRLAELQNPQDCDTARKLVCPGMPCGFGCCIHHMTYCLIVAYATQRTLVYPYKNVMYYKTEWDEVFQPLSNTCEYRSGDQKNIPAVPAEDLVVQLPAAPGYLAYTRFHPPAVPEDLLPTIRLFHGAPQAWWVGQMLRYLMRPQSRTTKLIEGALQRLNFSTPIVGIHVRRTDKLVSEAKYHSVDEYMAAVEDIYKTMEITTGAGARKIYVATDDVSVYKEINEKYPNYIVIGDQEISRMADSKTTHQKAGLDGILVDVHLLSMCDFVVCTFSSNICRLVYEVMQSQHTDASMRVTSLDYDYGYVGKPSLRLYRVILQHSARTSDEMNMNLGDIIALKFYNETNNFGYNINTNESGYFPVFKTVEDAKPEPFPTYSYI